MWSVNIYDNQENNKQPNRDVCLSFSVILFPPVIVFLRYLRQQSPRKTISFSQIILEHEVNMGDKGRSHEFVSIFLCCRNSNPSTAALVSAMWTFPGIDNMCLNSSDMWVPLVLFSMFYLVCVHVDEGVWTSGCVLFGWRRVVHW